MKNNQKIVNRLSISRSNCNIGFFGKKQLKVKAECLDGVGVSAL